jgi:hypothetical protein
VTSDAAQGSANASARRKMAILFIGVARLSESTPPPDDWSETELRIEN